MTLRYEVDKTVGTGGSSHINKNYNTDLCRKPGKTNKTNKI